MVAKSISFLVAGVLFLAVSQVDAQQYAKSLQSRADAHAARGVVWHKCGKGWHWGIGHFGGKLYPGCRAEGTGYSYKSPQDAIRNTCNYGKRRLVAYAVSRIRPGKRGAGAWVAVCHYR